MEESETPAKLGVRIERPAPEKIGSFYLFLVVLSFFLIAFTVWLLALEWSGQSLPSYLRLPVYM
ncbi:MAG: hypothetical protein HY583_03450 [Candidatus Omnitrophica bacterium]|nr:hypothetical protein [Candidatus Omnitrophota bacterium]